jgi:flagellar biosynthesis/type III secretory pathway protein FliH
LLINPVAAEYLKMANPAALALASRMRFDRSDRVSLTRDFFVRLAQTPISRAEQELVAGFYSAYQPLNGREALQLEREIAKVSSAMVREKTIQLTNPFIELGIQRGIQQGIQRGLRQGRQEGEAELVLRLLKRRLGALPAPQEKAIRRLELSQIEALGEALLEFSSRGDLTSWLRAQTRKHPLHVLRRRSPGMH